MVSISIGAMHSHNRVSAAELYVGAFRGEVKGLSLTARRGHLFTVVVMSLFALLLLYKILISPYWLPQPNPLIQRINVLTSGAAATERSEHILPHRILPLTKLPSEDYLRANFDMAGDMPSNSAVYIPIHANRLHLLLNGKKLLSSKNTSDNPLEMWRRSSLYLLPYNLLKSDNNELQIRLHSESDTWLEMSHIFVGASLPLQYRYDLNYFISNAVLWLVLVGSIWVVCSVLMLLYVGGNRFLLVSLPLSLMAAVLSLMQLSDTVWFFDLAYISFNYFLCAAFLVTSALISHRQLRTYTSFRLGLSANILISGSAITACYFDQIDKLELAWFLMMMIFVSIILAASFLLQVAVKQVLKEGEQSLNPFLLQVLHARLLSLVLSLALVCTGLGLVTQAPLILMNLIIFITLYNAAVLALLSGLSRTQMLADYRDNIRAKLVQQEQHLWGLSHEHLEAMRWTVIGQSAMTLVDKIRAPLMRIAGDLMVLKLDQNFEQNKVQWQRLKRSTDRCVGHVSVIEALVQDDNIQPASLRLDVFVTQCMRQLQESYAFSWQMNSEVKGWIEADPHYLESVIESLVDNAHHSAIAVEKRLHLELFLGREGDYVCLILQDNGDGIDAAVDVFQPFHSSRAFGLGIGVNLAQKHLKAMGGMLTLEPSEYGARFCIHLPIGTVL